MIKKPNFRTFRYLKKILSKHKFALIAVLGLVLLIEVISLLNPYLMGKLIDILTTDGVTIVDTYLVLVQILSVNLVSTLISYLKAYIDIKKYIFTLEQDLDSLSIENLLKFSVGQINSDNTGEIQSVIQSGTNNLSELIKQTLFTIVPIVVFLIASLVGLFLLSKSIFIIVFIFVIFDVIFAFWNNKNSENDFVETRGKWQKIDSFRMEIVRNASFIKFTDQVSEIINDFNIRFKKVGMFAIQDWVRYVFKSHLASLVAAITRTSILFVGAYHVLGKSLTIGDLMVIFGWSSSVMSKSGQLKSSFRYFMRSYPAVIKYFELMDREVDVKEEGDISKIRLGKIEFSNLSHSYKENPGDIGGSLEIKKHSLKNISFSLGVSEKLGVIGPSGAGKSTLVNLIMKSFNPDTGGLYIDNRPIDEYASSYKRDIGYIEQKPKLFDETVRYNLLFGVDGDISDIQLYGALEKVGLRKKIEELENSLDAKIGEQGVRFSGGESQRLSLANALLKEPKILILDEATSALDEMSQELINTTIDSMNCTTIIVAHRMSTIALCDKLLVLTHGVIEYFGPLSEAKEKSSTYHEMLQTSVLKIS